MKICIATDTPKEKSDVVSDYLKSLTGGAPTYPFPCGDIEKTNIATFYPFSDEEERDLNELGYEVF